MKFVQYIKDAILLGVPVGITLFGATGLFVTTREMFTDHKFKVIAETTRGAEEQRVVDLASAWLDSRGLKSSLHLQCTAEGQCALTYVRDGVLHGGMLRCYDKGCIALSGW